MSYIPEFFKAVENGELNVVRSFLLLGVNNWRRALEIASHNKDAKMIEIFIKYMKIDDLSVIIRLMAKAIEYDDLETCMYLHTYSPGILKVNENLVCFAAKNNSIRVLKFMISIGIPMINGQIDATYSAVENLETLKLVLDAADSDRHDYIHLLRYALSTENEEVISYIISLDTRIKENLYYAAMCGKYEIVEYAMSKGAKIGNGELNVLSGPDYERIFMYLVEHGSTPGPNEYGILHDAIRHNSLKVLKYLVSIGIDITGGLTWIYEAKDLEILEYIMSFVVDKSNVEVPIMTLISSGQLDKIKYLVDNGIKLYYDNLIVCATDLQQFEIVKYFIEKGADIKSVNADIAICLSIKHDRLDILELLIESGANLHKDVNKIGACYIKSSGMFRYLVSKDIKFMTNCEAIKYAFRSNNTDVIKYLLNEHGIEVTSEMLWWSVFHNNLSTVKYFVNKLGMKVNTLDSYRYRTCIRKWNVDMYKYMVSQGFDVTIDDNYCMHRELAENNAECIHYLVTQGLWDKVLSAWLYISILDERHLKYIDDERIHNIVMKRNRNYNYHPDIWFSFQ